MNYEEFYCKLIDAEIDINPYKPFSIDKKFWYDKKKPKDDRSYILQYWEIGGVSGGSCWDDSDPRSYTESGKRPKGFKELSKLLMVICPNLTFLQYQMLEDIIETGSETHYEYYGNCTKYDYELVDLEKLYKKLLEMETIKNE
jgi:hypothetical protein